MCSGRHCFRRQLVNTLCYCVHQHSIYFIYLHTQVKQLHDNANYFRRQLINMGLHVLGDWDSPVMPIMIYHPGVYVLKLISMNVCFKTYK